MDLAESDCLGLGPGSRSSADCSGRPGTQAPPLPRTLSTPDARGPAHRTPDLLLPPLPAPGRPAHLGPRRRQPPGRRQTTEPPPPRSAEALSNLPLWSYWPRAPPRLNSHWLTSGDVALEGPMGAAE